MDEFARVDRTHSNAEKYTLREKLFGTDEVIPMWVADMDIATPACVVDAVKERLNHPVIGYEMMPEKGYEAQIAWMSDHHGFEIKREWLTLSPSVVASIGCAIRALSDEGDEVIVMDPVYPPFYEMVKSNGRTLILNPLKPDKEGSYTFDLEDIRSKITPKTRVLLLCSPHNPVGRVWREDELRGLGALCLSHGIKIISDEIHCDIVYPPHTHIPIATLSDELLHSSVTLLGPGKTFNMAGFSISSVCIADEAMRKRYDLERHRMHWGEGGILSHVAFEAAYTCAQEWYRHLIGHLDNNRQLIEEWCATHPLIRYHKSEGTYLAWLDCRSLGLGDRELRDFFVRKAGIGLSPGLSFGREGTGFMRLNFAVDSKTLETALENLDKALRRIDERDSLNPVYH